MELAALQEVVADIENFGASIVVISPQLEKYSKQVAKKNHLTFSVLSDKENRVAADFGLVFSLPDDLRKLYQKFGIDFNRFYGNDSASLPMPGRFISDDQGKIIHKDVHPDYTKRPEPTDIIKLIKSKL